MGTEFRHIARELYIRISADDSIAMVATDDSVSTLSYLSSACAFRRACLSARVGCRLSRMWIPSKWARDVTAETVRDKAFAMSGDSLSAPTRSRSWRSSSAVHPFRRLSRLMRSARSRSNRNAAKFPEKLITVMYESQDQQTRVNVPAAQMLRRQRWASPRARVCGERWNVCARKGTERRELVELGVAK